MLDREGPFLFAAGGHEDLAVHGIEPRQLGELAVQVDYLELLCKRAISAAVNGGDALGSASLAKSVWAEVGQSIAAFAFDVLGPRQTTDRWSRQRLAARSLTIAGGTTQINKGVTATRVLGLPRK